MRVSSMLVCACATIATGWTTLYAQTPATPPVERVRFARLQDPEGNPIQLWQPKDPRAARD